MARKTTILLVEDDTHDADLMRLAFNEAHTPYGLKLVQHGAEAVKYLAGEGQYADREQFPLPDLVLLDLRMPQMDGFDVLRWMRKQSGSTMPPVIILSYSRLEEDRKLARELGAQKYVIKPVDFTGAVAFVQSLSGFQRNDPVSETGVAPGLPPAN